MRATRPEMEVSRWGGGVSKGGGGMPEVVIQTLFLTRLTLKGIVSRHEYFFKVYSIIMNRNFLYMLIKSHLRICKIIPEAACDMLSLAHFPCSQ
jgi:hypothetical protein